MGRKPRDMIGLQFGTLTVLGEAVASTPRFKVFDVKCSACGDRRMMGGGNIRRSQKSGWAGCVCQSRAVKHGMSSHPAYKTWDGMINRCYNSSHEAYHRYGGRGIGVCEEWRASPHGFISWLEDNGWKRGLEIDRRDNDGGYFSGNCRVVSRVENSNNTSTNRRIKVDGETLSISQAARKYGLKKTTVKERLNRGWSPSEAVHGR